MLNFMYVCKYIYRAREETGLAFVCMLDAPRIDIFI